MFQTWYYSGSTLALNSYIAGVTEKKPIFKYYTPDQVGLTNLNEHYNGFKQLT